MKTRCDVLVAGGGPAGATAARLLAEKGLSVILVQKDLSYDKPCGGALPLSAFDEFGLDRSLITRTVGALSLVAPSGYSVEVPLQDASLAVVDRVAFDRHLRRLAETAGATLIEGRCRNADADGAEIVTETGEIRVEAAYIVAADGVNSSLRKHLTGELPKRVLSLYAKVPERLTAGCEFRFGKTVAPGHYAWSFVRREGAHIGVIADDEREIRRHFETYCRELGLEKLPKPRGFYIPLWKDDLYRKGNVLFVGDAAGQVSPFTYEGIYYAMRSAAYAAEAIGRGEPERYEALWRANLQRRFRAMELLRRLLLRWEWSAEKLVRLQAGPAVRAAALRFWRGRSVPATSLQTLWKGLKLLLRR